MPFTIELSTQQKTKKWTFKRTKEALELQALLEQGNRKGYGKRLIELSPAHKFTRVDGIVYELFDEGEMINVPIRFQVKGSVITWAFVAPKDATHQSFRDLVFNTAAKAHACVSNSCETYYRGTDHFHIKVMHSYPKEADFNHNHYRTANDGPITPVEVYQHLMGFYAQGEGKQFLTSLEERNTIILKFAIYWAEYNADIRYASLYLLDGEAGKPALTNLLHDIAKLGSLTPHQADVMLDDFFSSENGKQIFQLALQRGFPFNNLYELKNYLSASYQEIYFNVAEDIQKDIAMDGSLEPHLAGSDQSAGKSSKRSSPSSPREEYESGLDQTLDEIDLLEKETFANDLTKHCQSIDKRLLQDLELDDFRKALILYHALRTAQQNSKLMPGDGCRFHTDLTTENNIRAMIIELPFLQSSST